MNSQSTLCCVSAAVITSSYPCSISFSCLLIIPHLTFPIPVLCIAFSALTLPFIPVGLVFPHLTFPTYSIVRNYLFSCISTWSSCSNAQRLFTPLSPHFMCLPQKLGQSRASEMQASVSTKLFFLSLSSFPWPLARSCPFLLPPGGIDRLRAHKVQASSIHKKIF